MKLLVISAEKKSKRDGNAFYSIVFSDGKDSIKAVYWSATPDITSFVGKVVTTDGIIQEYNGERQYRVDSISISNDSDPMDYCPRSKYDEKTLMSQFNSLMASICDPNIKKLLELIFTEETIEAFTKHPAAKRIHHAFVGGLLQHSVAVATAAASLASLYKAVDSDVVIASALLHDIGKLQELSAFPAVDYNPIGNIIGHTALGLIIVSNAIDKIPEIDETKKLKILNCVASHHGQLDFGAINLPSCAEAFIVSTADYLDSRIEIAIEASKDIKSGELTGTIPALNTRIISV